jgi:cholesterol transport system auxiliary component
MNPTFRRTNSVPIPRRRGARLTAVLAFAALVAGCASLLPPPSPAPNLHVLDAVPAATTPSPERRDLVLEVSAPKAWPGFDTPQMAYVRKPHALDYYASNRWADAPARMIVPSIARALEQTGAFRAVVQAPTTVAADLRLSTELVRLQQNFAAKPSEVELALHVQVIDVRGRRVVATRTFEATEAAPSEDAYGGVIAANRALARVLAQVAAFCVAESARLR